MAGKVATQQRPVRRWLEDLARRQHWVIATRQLTGAGIPRGTIDAWLARRQLYPVHHGVYKLGPAPLTARGMLSAAVLTCSRNPLVSSDSAVGLHGLERIRVSEVHLTVVGGGSRSRRGIVVHRTSSLHPDDRAIVDGIPVTSVPRTLVDIAGDDPRRLRRAVEEADGLGLLAVRECLAACDRARGKRGVGRLRALLAELTAPEPTIGELERRFRWECEARLPRALQPRYNAPFGGWKLDAYWPAHRIAVELDSVAHHADRPQIRRDLRKNLDLADAGIDLLRLGWAEVTAETARTFDVLARRLGTGEA